VSSRRRAAADGPIEAGLGSEVLIPCGSIPCRSLNHLGKHPFQRHYLRRKSVQYALNSPSWFPWQRPVRHLDCNAVERGDSLVPAQDHYKSTTQGYKAAIRATTKEYR